MGMTESITIFTDRTITKNASIVLGSPIYMGKFGPNDKVYADITASGGGNVAVYYQVGRTQDDTFFTPGPASNIGVQRSTLGSGASRDLHPVVEPLMMPWMTFKAKEINASPVVMSFNLNVVKG